MLVKTIKFVGGQAEGGLKMLPNVVRAQIDVAAHRALEASYDVARRSRMTYKNPILCIVQLVCFMAYLVACRQPWQNYLFRQPLFFMGYRVWQLNMVKIRKACRRVWNAGLYLDQAVQVLPMMELIHHFWRPTWPNWCCGKRLDR